MNSLESSVIRHLIFKAKLTATPQRALLMADIVQRVISMAVSDGFLRQEPSHDQRSALESKVTEVIWELIIEGVYTPGLSLGQPNLPYLRITEFGRKCFEAGELTPHDPDAYLERLKSACSKLDATMVLYTGEALDTFRAGNYLATAVMVGVAAESMLLRLVDRVGAALNTPERKDKFEKATKGKKAKTQHDELLARLKSPATPLPTELADVLTQQIDGIYDLIRRTRNDAGHPTGKKMERDETHALLLLFPTYCKTVCELMDWLATNQI